MKQSAVKLRRFAQFSSNEASLVGRYFYHGRGERLRVLIGPEVNVTSPVALGDTGRWVVWLVIKSRYFRVSQIQSHYALRGGRLRNGYFWKQNCADEQDRNSTVRASDSGDGKHFLVSFREEQDNLPNLTNTLSLRRYLFKYLSSLIPSEAGRWRCVALLRSRGQSILLNFGEVPHVLRCKREMDFLRTNRHAHIRCTGGRAAVRSEILWRNALALHRPVPRRPHRGHYRRPSPAKCFLHGGGERRRLEDNRFRQHVEPHFR